MSSDLDAISQLQPPGGVRAEPRCPRLGNVGNDDAAAGLCGPRRDAGLSAPGNAEAPEAADGPCACFPPSASPAPTRGPLTAWHLCGPFPGGCKLFSGGTHLPAGRGRRLCVCAWGRRLQVGPTAAPRSLEAVPRPAASCMMRTLSCPLGLSPGFLS